MNLLIVFVMCSSLTLSCLSKKAPSSLHDISESIGRLPVQYDFCTNSDSSKVWNRPKLERELTELISDLGRTLNSPYPVAYLEMTAKRDIERCGNGRLVVDNKIHQAITHHLSDIMSRYLISETRQCSFQRTEQEYGICGIQPKLRSMDTLSSAMMATSTYISSHISLSLSAIAHDDSFWEELIGTVTLDQRRNIILAYKPTYDLFNRFLADNLETVVTALKSKDLIRGNTLDIASQLGQAIPGRSLVFGNIRDRAFDVAIEMITSQSEHFLPAEQHPMIQKDMDNGYTVSFKPIEQNFATPQILIDLEKSSHSKVVNGPARWVFENVLGGLKADEL